MQVKNIWNISKTIFQFQALDQLVQAQNWLQLLEGLRRTKQAIQVSTNWFLTNLLKQCIRSTLNFLKSLSFLQQSFKWSQIQKSQVGGTSHFDCVQRFGYFEKENLLWNKNSASFVRKWDFGHHWFFQPSLNLAFWKYHKTLIFALQIQIGTFQQIDIIRYTCIAIYVQFAFLCTISSNVLIKGKWYIKDWIIWIRNSPATSVETTTRLFERTSDIYKCRNFPTLRDIFPNFFK